MLKKHFRNELLVTFTVRCLDRYAGLRISRERDERLELSQGRSRIQRILRHRSAFAKIPSLPSSYQRGRSIDHHDVPCRPSFAAENSTGDVAIPFTPGAF